ncbi:beta-fructofuranosidase, insoluble isoenzyme CWINV1-like [Cynara cardunculus var. scolymus]|uniref:beta-fructofuranosidase, insoluble isoenzyme CWINV1-like n=1 Tax=Cynara cardunculus var. scolymus TaxID=59895 RepID=UPI000D626948|nr:beta-fructofuranosidase, insoluble isoenzyme CWINV1-like [Cynara cardunculus var. scolymus]
MMWLGRWVVCVCLVMVVNGVRVDADDELQPYRTAFHFQPLKNWMNDPNGPMYFNGVYHLFYQYNPYGPLWGNISWGHSISYDLINWFLLQPALTPNQPTYDINGCLSGSTTILNAAKPIILYTGQDLNNTQLQNIAFPKNLSDPLLRHWIKWSGNPILTPINDINPAQFRDPSTAWKGPDGKWRIVIGSEIDGHGTALLYRSTDGINWTRSEKPLHFSSKTGMWECPDFYPVANDGKRGLDTSVQGNNTMHVLKTSYNSREYYVIGNYDAKADRFGVIGNDFTVSSTQLQYDYGRFYASKSFYDNAKQRRVLWGWVNEGDSGSDAVKKGWSGLQSFPRSVWLSDTRKQLVQWPVDEIEKLRTKQVNITNRELKGRTLLEIPSITASQADVEVSFSLSNLNEADVINSEMVDPQLLCAQKNASVSGSLGPFGLLVLASKNLTERTAVFFRVFKGPNKFLVLMCSDQSKSSIAQEVDKSIYGAFLDLDPHHNIPLRSLIDHSIVESFGGEGLACMTARVYPKLATNEDTKLYVFNNGTQTLSISNLNAWSMNKAKILPLP